jgi:hypothetical protein
MCVPVWTGRRWGGFPVPDPSVIGTISNPSTAPLSDASITITGTIINKQPNGLVLLTNQFQPNGLVGNIQVNRIFTSSLLTALPTVDVSLSTLVETLPL